MTPFQPTPGRTRKTRKDLISPLLLLHTYVQEKKILGEALFQKRISAHMIHFNCATYGIWHGPSSCSECRVRGGAKLVENEFGNIMRGERVRKSVNFPPPPSPENWFAGTARGTKKIQFKDSSSSSPHADPTRPAAAFSSGGGRRGKRRCVIHFPLLSLPL